jgi:hypothetical protein
LAFSPAENIYGSGNFPKHNISKVVAAADTWIFDMPK